MKIYESVEQMIGNTPLLHAYPELPATLLYKLESFNPAGSAKDRTAIALIRQAEKKGFLKPGGTIIEPTSGNTGIGLAAYGVPMGYRVIIVMPDTMSAERINLIRAYGAEIVLTPGKDGMSGSIATARELAGTIPDSFIPGQFDNPDNPYAHYTTTGPEIWRDTDGNVDVLVAGIGTGGTLCGTAAYLKEMKKSVICIGCEPAASPVITKGKSGHHGIQGIGANFIPGNYNPYVVDEVFCVSDEDAVSETVAIARKYGILTGISSGCAAYAARMLASRPDFAGKTIVAILPDTGEHYISTGIFG